MLWVHMAILSFIVDQWLNMVHTVKFSGLDEEIACGGASPYLQNSVALQIVVSEDFQGMDWVALFWISLNLGINLCCYICFN